jgi:hypothetical protein
MLRAQGVGEAKPRAASETGFGEVTLPPAPPAAPKPRSPFPPHTPGANAEQVEKENLAYERAALHHASTDAMRTVSLASPRAAQRGSGEASRG